MGDVNIEDIGTAADPMVQAPLGGTAVIPQLAAPIPIEAGGGLPQIQAPTVSSVPALAPPPPPAFQVVHPDQSIPQLPEPVQIGGPPPPMIRIAEPIGISAGHEKPAKSHLSSVPAAPQANPDGLASPAPSSIREPTAVEKVANAEAERAKLQDQQAEAVAEQATQEANAAQARADEQKRQIEEQDRLAAQQRDAMVEAKRVRDAAREETKNFKFHDYFEKGRHSKVQAGIALILGGLSSDPNHVNQVVGQINTQIARDLQGQEQKLKLQQDDASAKAGDVVDLLKQHQEEWNKLKFKQGEQIVAVGNQFDVMALKAKGSQKVLEAKQLAQQYRATGQALIQNTEENIAKQHLTEAQTKHALAQANEANALAHFHRVTGGNAKAEKAAAADSAATRSAMEKFAKQHNLVGEKGLGQSIQTLGATLENAKAATQNPMTQITILDNIIRDATHLGVRPQTLKLYQEHLGGLRAMGESKAQGWVNGTVGKKAWKTVVDHLQNQYAEKLKEGQAANENFNRVFKGDKAYPFAKRAKETAAAGETDIFSQMPGWAAGQGGATPTINANAPSTQPQSITTPDGKVHTFQGDGTYSK